MKKLFTIFMCVLVLISIHTTTFAQTEGIPKHALSFKVLQIDHYSPVRDDAANWFDDFSGGAELGYSYNFNEHLSLSVPVKLGVANYPVDNTNSNTLFTGDKLYFSADVTGVFRVLKYDNWFNPYLMAGIGAANKDGDDWHAQLPVGAGINLRLAKGFFVNFQYELRFAQGDNHDNNYQFGGGLWVPFGGGLKEEPKELPPVDSDGDGIPDKDDACPQEAGLAAFGGCPDTDSDGIPDKDDQCPEAAGDKAFNGCPDSDNDGLADPNDDCPQEAGPIDNKGCPIQDRDSDGTPDDKDACPDDAGPANLQGCPDTDGDGIADRNDDCPKIAGLASLKGCPDSDGDGVKDSIDKCPNTAGPASNQGCPEMKPEEKEVLTFAMKAVQFETASATLKTTSYQVLDQIVEILKKYPAYHVSIDGHTDSIGKVESNQSLSEKRAKSAYDYLVKKGIPASRMSYTGYGESKPIADNKYKDGRALNRRVEFNIYLP